MAGSRGSTPPDRLAMDRGLKLISAALNIGLLNARSFRAANWCPSGSGGGLLCPIVSLVVDQG